MFIGIDSGTSAVKIVLVDEAEATLATAEIPLAPTFPRPGWVEDDPECWWKAVCTGLDGLARDHSAALSGVTAIGLSGQMHSAVLLDAGDVPVRPAILWNDGRASAEASELARRFPELAVTLGVMPMPGFTGPKLLWLARHEPDVFTRAKTLCFAKDYLRLRLAGEMVTDVTDASGGWLLDQRRRAWSEAAVTACGAEHLTLPPALESITPAGRLRPRLAARWGMGRQVIVVAGAGDVAAGGVGIGAIAPGKGFLSLGTSAQIFLAGDSFMPNPERLVHAFCHALPRRWFTMAAMLNGASPLAAAARWLGGQSVGEMLAAVERGYSGPSRLLALPYLFGERTPHNDPQARGAFVGIDGMTTSRDLMQAMMEGVAFSLADGLDALVEGERAKMPLALIGGGSRSAFWARIIASILDCPLVRYASSDHGPAFGAARLARLAAQGEDAEQVVVTPPVRDIIPPDPALREAYAPRRALFQQLYWALKPVHGSIPDQLLESPGMS